MSTPSGQQQQPYLPTARQFPVQNPIQLEPELVKSYIDIALAVNLRTIGIFEPVQIVTGERWFGTDTTTTTVKRQTYRQVYPFGAVAIGASLSFNHNISSLTQCTRIYGTCITDVPDFRPIPYASVTASANQIELLVTPTQITIKNGAGSQNIVSGIIILEYLLN